MSDRTGVDVEDVAAAGIFLFLLFFATFWIILF